MIFFEQCSKIFSVPAANMAECFYVVGVYPDSRFNDKPNDYLNAIVEVGLALEQIASDDLIGSQSFSEMIERVLKAKIPSCKRWKNEDVLLYYPTTLRFVLITKRDVFILMEDMKRRFSKNRIKVTVDSPETPGNAQPSRNMYATA